MWYRGFFPSCYVHIDANTQVSVVVGHTSTHVLLYCTGHIDGTVF